MKSFAASSVGSPVQIDLDHGEGSIHFSWPDPMFGREGLRITLDGHCSRNMPIRSGYGLRDFTICRDRVSLHFSPQLARSLELSKSIEITFTLSDEEFARLEAAFESVAFFA